ncbi:MAG: class I SAM-dependent methyltransferase [Rhodospirillales bacterium]|nr:class I SAM-dependent methyltransferase [Rhodospirillales bacterium]
MAKSIKQTRTTHPARQGAEPNDRRASPTTGCKLCGGASPQFGVVDFNKTCHEQSGQRLPLSGSPVYYRRCGDCGFLFTEAFDAFTSADFETRIYNADYPAIDPDFAERRPRANAALIAKLFGAARAVLSVLDYGGGVGLLADILSREGWRIGTHDPFHGEDDPTAAPPAGPYDLITCFEVFEHATEPKALIDTLARLLASDGLLLFSTLLQPADIEKIRLNWWYAAPRNGHISLFSKRSLAALCSGAGLTLASFNDGLHVAYRRLPAFAKHLMAEQAADR